MKLVSFLLSSFCLLVAIHPVLAQENPTKAVYNIRDYNAVGDGKTLDSPAINKAIDACAAAGGGTVDFPAGTYLCGSIHLQSNIHLLLETGSVILGAPQEMNAYDFTEPFDGPAYQDGGHTYFHNSLIWGENLTNISITGKGLIQGGGLVRDDGHEGQTKNYVPERLGNKAIALKLCTGILIRDISISHGGHFAIIVTGCKNETIDNVTIDTNRDGIDIDSCADTMVSNCRVNAPTDDAICPKSSYALGKSVATENLTIVHCQVTGYKEGTFLDGTLKPGWGGHSRIKLGTESNGGFRNVTITDCTFNYSRGLALEEVDGGVMENITVRNIKMSNVTDYPIYVTTGKRNRGPDSTLINQARNILISGVVATDIDPRSGIQITGLPEQPIEGLRLENIRLVFKGGGTAEQANHIPGELGIGYPDPSHLDVTSSYGIFARHVKGLEFSNIDISFKANDLRPALSFTDVDGLTIDNLKAAVAAGVPVVKYDSVKNVTIRNSPNLPAPSP